MYIDIVIGNLKMIVCKFSYIHKPRMIGSTLKKDFPTAGARTFKVNDGSGEINKKI